MITQLASAKTKHEEGQLDMSDMIQALESKIKEAQKKTYSNLSGWQKVQISRHAERPYTLDIVFLFKHDNVHVKGF